MNWLDRLFNWISIYAPWDKCLHFIGGTLIALVTIGLGFGISVAFVGALAISKEVWDWRNPPHHADPLDALATCLGALPIWIVWGVCR